MKNFLFQNQWGWRASGVALASIFVLAVFLVKPIGVSTQVVILDGIMWKTVSDQIIIQDSNSKHGYSSTNAYLNKGDGKYAKNIANPLNYEFIFVLSMAIGGLVARKAQGKHHEHQNMNYPDVWVKRFGDSIQKRYVATFLGGFLVLFGARLAGGCTSGHMVSGMMQTSFSGYLFALGAFAAAIPLAIIVYKWEN